MPSIRDQTYRLPVIHAQNAFKLYDTGTNKPLVIRGIEEYSRQKMDAVVKFRAAERMSEQANMREVLAAFIAMEWDISVVEPAIIQITLEFVNTLRGISIYEIASRSLGLNVGSLLEKGKRDLAILEPLSKEQKEHAIRIFCFDAFIMNTDRTIQKPNMITDGEVITIFDHEIAFSFILDLLKNPEPWKFRQNDINFLESHCLYRKIKGDNFPVAFLEENIDKLDGDFWDRAEQLIPNEWLSEQFDEIRDYLNTILDHKDQFINELRRVLA